MHGITRIVEVVLYQVLSLSGMVGPLWDLCECKVKFGNVFVKISEANLSFCAHRKKSIQTEVKPFITKMKKK